jgi:hypothetical protein
MWPVLEFVICFLSYENLMILFDIKGSNFLVENKMYLQKFAHFNRILDSYKSPASSK